jgi:hypothetical protein
MTPEFALKFRQPSNAREIMRMSFADDDNNNEKDCAATGFSSLYGEWILVVIAAYEILVVGSVPMTMSPTEMLSR